MAKIKPVLRFPSLHELFNRESVNRCGRERIQSIGEAITEAVASHKTRNVKLDGGYKQMRTSSNEILTVQG